MMLRRQGENAYVLRRPREQHGCLQWRLFKLAKGTTGYVACKSPLTACVVVQVDFDVA